MPVTLSSRTHGRSTTEPSSLIPAPAKNRPWLLRLLAGDVESVPFAPVAVPTVRLHPTDAAFVGRVLGCPDLFLLDCADSASRERHILNIVRAAADRGERFLVISPDPAAADRLVEALAADRSIRVVRALSDDENPMRPSPAVSRLTSASAGAGRAEQIRREAVQTVQALEANFVASARSRELHSKRDAIETERQVLLNRSAKSAEPPARCREIQTERDTIRNRMAELERLSKTKSGVLARLFGFAKPATDHSKELKQLAERDAALVAECEAATRQRTEESEKEYTTRLAELGSEAAGIEAALLALHPQAATEDTVENGARGTSELERELAVARTRHQELTAAGPELPRSLLAETQIVVGTPGAVECDPVFEATGSAPFDRLLLDHAEELSEAAFDRFSQLATKWILAGDGSPPPPPVANGRPARARPVEPSLLSRLARHLDREPWRIDGNHLIIRLVHLKPAQRKDLVREPLIDHPDVEVGVVIIDGEPVVADIAFPAATAIPAAKSFLFSQLSEVVLRTCGDPQWVGLTANWPAFDSCECEWIELEPGVREKLAVRGSAVFTAAIEFDPATWDETAAREWIAAHASHSASRLAALPCDRSRPPAYAR